MILDFIVNIAQSRPILKITVPFLTIKRGRVIKVQVFIVFERKKRSRSAGQEILCILRNPKAHYRVHKSPLLDPILSGIHSIPSQPIYLRPTLITSMGQHCLWTATSNRPIVPPPVDTGYMRMQSRRNGSGMGYPEKSENNLSQCHFFNHKPHMDWPGREPWHPRWNTGTANSHVNTALPLAPRPHNSVHSSGLLE